LFDLVIRHGRVIDPGARLDRQLDVGFRDGRVAALEADLPLGDARQVVEADGRLVVPGLIDLHTHVYWGGTSLGVDADALARRSGTTTFVDAGSAGPGNFPGFRHHVIERSRSRIIAYLNISFAGIYGFSRNVMVANAARSCSAMRARRSPAPASTRTRLSA
jgi:dihydroorotase